MNWTFFPRFWPKSRGACYIQVRVIAGILRYFRNDGGSTQSELFWGLPPPIKLEKSLNNLKCVDMTLYPIQFNSSYKKCKTYILCILKFIFFCTIRKINKSLKESGPVFSKHLNFEIFLNSNFSNFHLSIDSFKFYIESLFCYI